MDVIRPYAPTGTMSYVDDDDDERDFVKLGGGADVRFTQ